MLGLCGPLSRNGAGAAEGNAEGSKKEQDKSRVSQVTPGRSQRPAVRAAFRAFTNRGRDFTNCLEGLAGVRFWGHFQAEKTPLASDLPETQLFQGTGTVSILLSQALLAEKHDFDRCPHEMDRPKNEAQLTRKVVFERWRNRAQIAPLSTKRKGATSTAEKICV